MPLHRKSDVEFKNLPATNNKGGFACGFVAVIHLFGSSGKADLALLGLLALAAVPWMRHRFKKIGPIELHQGAIDAPKTLAASPESAQRRDIFRPARCGSGSFLCGPGQTWSANCSHSRRCKSGRRGHPKTSARSHGSFPHRPSLDSSYGRS